MEPASEVMGLGEYIRSVETNRVLQVEKLSKSFENRGNHSSRELLVLDEISFDVAEGEFVTIIGPSGCGKTTLLNIIAGLDGYDGGDVIVEGHRVKSTGPDSVMIFQEPALFPWLDVAGNVEFGLKMNGVSREERKRISAQYIEMVGLTPFANSYVHQLSGGMKQRTALARGLALNPRILLMDEPFASVDAKTRENLQRQIQEIHRQTRKTIIFVTHDVREAICLGDRVILLSRSPTKIRQQYLVDVPRPRRVEDPALNGLIVATLKEMREEREHARCNDGESNQEQSEAEA